MSTTQDPAQGLDTLTDFSANIVKQYRMVNVTGGTQFVFKDKHGKTKTVLADDYARINDKAMWVTEITSATDCTSVFAWE